MKVPLWTSVVLAVVVAVVGLWFGLWLDCGLAVVGLWLDCGLGCLIFVQPIVLKPYITYTQLYICVNHFGKIIEYGI